MYGTKDTIVPPKGSQLTNSTSNLIRKYALIRAIAIKLLIHSRSNKAFAHNNNNPVM